MVSSIYGSSSQVASFFQAQRQAAFNKVDSDGSGGLSLDEFKSAATQSTSGASGTTASASDIESLFKSIDSNSDGQVSSDELDSAAKKAFEARFSKNASAGSLVQGQDFAQQFLSKADSDGNGTLSLDEFSAAKPKDAPSGGPSSDDIFAQLDSDGDGELTSAELTAGKPQGGLGGPQGAGGPPPGGPPPGGGGGPQGAGGAHGGGGISSKDSNDDDSNYDEALDTNGDGVVSAAERAAGTSGGGLDSLISKMINTLLSAQEQSAAA